MTGFFATGFFATGLITAFDLSDDRHLRSLITCSVKVCDDYYELNN
jgi:hypothetical protein